jgi:hypothetical protein
MVSQEKNAETKLTNLHSSPISKKYMHITCNTERTTTNKYFTAVTSELNVLAKSPYENKYNFWLICNNEKEQLNYVPVIPSINCLKSYCHSYEHCRTG